VSMSLSDESAPELKDRLVLVTGAASGIGAAVCKLFLKAGAIVAGLDVNPAMSTHFNCQVDLSNEVSLAEALRRVQEKFGMPEVLVHAAALPGKGSVLDSRLSSFAEVYNVNVISAVQLIQWCVPGMRLRKKGSIIFLSSINANFATPTLAPYAASKAALNNLTKTAALELAADGIRVNAIAPASIDTPMLRSSYDSAEDGLLALERNVHRHPLERFGAPEEVAELALFLATDRSAWITGAIMPIDGGASVTRR